MDHNELRKIAERFFDEYESLTEQRKFEILRELNDVHRHSIIDEKIKSILNDSELNSKQRSATKRKYEKKKHALYVKECLMPQGYDNEHGEVFALLLPPEIEDINDSEYIEYHISLVTPAMAYTDFRFLVELNPQTEDKPWWYKEYRPYYYDLSICVNKNDTEWKDFYNRHREGDWVRAYLTTSSEESQGIKQNGLLRFGGSDSFAYNVSIEFKKQKMIDDGIQPDVRKNEVRELKKLYNDSLKTITTTKASDYLNSVLPSSVNTYTADILNVGEANCIHIEADNRLSFMFDVGVPFEKYRDPFPYGPITTNKDYAGSAGINMSIGRLAKYKPDFILISHWHFDHIAGFIHMCDDGLNCHWVVPKLDDDVNDITCVRIVLYFAKNGNLSIIDGGYSSSIYMSKNMDIELFRGEDKNNAYGKKDLNAGCVMLRIRKTLFVADCMYQHWPDALKKIIKTIDWLIAPHHGAEVTKNDTTVMANFKGKKRKAIVCVGNNGYPHPRDSHFEALINNDLDSIYVTGGAKQIKYFGIDIKTISHFIDSNKSYKIPL